MASIKAMGDKAFAAEKTKGGDVPLFIINDVIKRKHLIVKYLSHDKQNFEKDKNSKVSLVKVKISSVS